MTVEDKRTKYPKAMCGQCNQPVQIFPITRILYPHRLVGDIATGKGQICSKSGTVAP